MPMIYLKSHKHFAKYMFCVNRYTKLCKYNMKSFAKRHLQKNKEISNTINLRAK